MRGKHIITGKKEEISDRFIYVFLHTFSHEPVGLLFQSHEFLFRFLIRTVFSRIGRSLSCINIAHPLVKGINGICNFLVDVVVFCSRHSSFRTDIQLNVSLFHKENIAVDFIAFLVIKEETGNDGRIAFFLEGKFSLMQYNRIGWGEVTVGHSCQIQRIAVLGIFHCSLYFTVLRRARGEKAYEA